MKTKQILLFALAGFLFVACKDSNTAVTESSKTQEVKTEIKAENLQTASFIIDGMHCEFGCAKGIEKKLAKLDGIQSATINFETKEATIEYDATVHTPQILAEAVEAMSDKYEVSGIKSSSDQSSLYFDQEQEKSKKDKKAKKSKKSKKQDSKTEASTTEKKACCSGKSSCGSKSKSGNI